MGGESTGVTEETTNVFIESAYFDPVRTGAHRPRCSASIPTRAIASSAASIRNTSLPGLDLATKLVMEFCGGEPSRRHRRRPRARHQARDRLRSRRLVEKLTRHEDAPGRGARHLGSLGLSNCRRHARQRPVVASRHSRPGRSRRRGRAHRGLRQSAVDAAAAPRRRAAARADADAKARARRQAHARRARPHRGDDLVLRLARASRRSSAACPTR